MGSKTMVLILMIPVPLILSLDDEDEEKSPNPRKISELESSGNLWTEILWKSL